MKDKAIQLREALEQINEDLLTLSDDIWLNIDHNDLECLEAGVAIKKQYNKKIEAFGQLSAEIESLLDQWAGEVASETTSPPPLVKPGSKQDRERIIRDLDRHQPHKINEDFRFKRPCGMIIEGQPYQNLNTWKSVYRVVAQHLARKDNARFNKLPQQPLAITKRGNPMIANKPEGMRVSELFAKGLYFEVNLSANMIRDAIKRLLKAFNVSDKSVTFYLREDRDAR
jgi:parvulin-like peptidyl-prolyl isomerase